MFSLYPLEFESSKQDCHEKDLERCSKRARRRFKDQKLEGKRILCILQVKNGCFFQPTFKDVVAHFSVYSLECVLNMQNCHAKDRERCRKGVRRGYENPKCEEK